MSETTSLPPPTPAPSLPAAQSPTLSTEALPPPPGIAAALQPGESAAGVTASAAANPLPASAQPASQPPTGKPAAPTSGAGLGASAAAQKGMASPEISTQPPRAIAPEPATLDSAASPNGKSTGKALAGGAAGLASLEPPAQAPVEIPEPGPRGSGKFLWPVNGKVVSPFGLKEGGLHNDGINISAPLGTPVHAAENGTVVYAGNELRGFGNLLLIRHADGWVSAYAHCEALLVKRGDKVHRGQVVARVGQTGAVSSPQLHFELRKGAQAVDPMGELGPQGA